MKLFKEFNNEDQNSINEIFTLQNLIYKIYDQLSDDARQYVNETYKNVQQSHQVASES